MITKQTPGLLALVIFSAAVLSLFPAPSFGQENPCPFTGYLWGTGARSSFEVYADSEDLAMVFTWPAGTTDWHLTLFLR